MTCTAGSLAGLGLRDRHHLQALGSSLAAVGSRLHKACVHHIPHPRHCHRGLSYIGGQDDLQSTAIPMTVQIYDGTLQRMAKEHQPYCTVFKADKLFVLFQTRFCQLAVFQRFPRLYIASAFWPVQTCIPATLGLTQKKAFQVEQFQKDIHGRQEDLKRKQMQWEPQRHPILQSPAAALLANAAHVMKASAAMW